MFNLFLLAIFILSFYSKQFWICRPTVFNERTRREWVGLQTEGRRVAADTNLCFSLRNTCVDTNKSTKLYTLLKDTVSMEMCPKNDKKSQIFLTLIFRLRVTLWLQYALSYYSIMVPYYYNCNGSRAWPVTAQRVRRRNRPLIRVYGPMCTHNTLHFIKAKRWNRQLHFNYKCLFFVPQNGIPLYLQV